MSPNNCSSISQLLGGTRERVAVGVSIGVQGSVPDLLNRIEGFLEQGYGRVIFTTLIGLSCGLDLPHVAVLATIFGYILIYVLDSSVAYRIDIRSLPPKQVVEAAAAYRALLEQNDCRIVSEKKDPGKKRVAFIFRTSKHDTYHHLHDLLETQIDGSLKGSVNWEID